ncbi:HIT family protein [Haloarchaeobius sp. HME9146]|uniref:HIT family protein n=1 Tax=Haloarchaeobius sp. HME9146 TaxID=2978732 RepID=UPI0021BEE281|nr:HIT domain-containing protein [Haloarchaeobius sp. HME9146]MCT9095116.1 HIT domain-containing protein [Haloarchaeobius sp. HME9146]
MDCIFCDIVAGEADALVLDETDETLAFAPLDPFSEGHLLVVPKAHHESLFDIPEEALRAVSDHARDIATRLQRHGFDGVNLLHDSGEAAHQSVAHFHLHVAPRRAGDGLDLWPEHEYESRGRDVDYSAVREALGGDK